MFKNQTAPAPEVQALNTALASRDDEAGAKAIKAIEAKYGKEFAAVVVADIVNGAAEMQRRTR